jgi:meiotically up-regulated gene 157 (Mug157) protein
MFAVVILGYIEEIAKEIYRDITLEEKANKLKTDINNGIEEYGIYDHPKYGRMYAYETDGIGNYILMDDANVPSLMSIPYIEYKKKDDPIYINTRNFILSEDNPYYFKGTHAQGVGSPHTPDGYIWHIALIMQALTSKDSEEVENLIATIVKTDAKTGYMHEGFDVNNPENFTRSWFAWANSLFGELIYSWLIEKV